MKRQFILTSVLMIALFGITANCGLFGESKWLFLHENSRLSVFYREVPFSDTVEIKQVERGGDYSLFQMEVDGDRVKPNNEIILYNQDGSEVGRIPFKPSGGKWYSVDKFPRNSSIYLAVKKLSE